MRGSVDTVVVGLKRLFAWSACPAVRPRYRVVLHLFCGSTISMLHYVDASNAAWC